MTPAAYYHKALRQLTDQPDSAWPDIEAAYGGRPYHNLNHLAEMLGHLTALQPAIAPAAAPYFAVALVYHDIVYKAHRQDNEARSADAAEAALRALNSPPERITYCRELIMATKTHVATTADQGWLNDLDLAVLARPANGYDEYAAAVRKEFAIYPGFLYRRGRKKALAHLLAQDRIYYHPEARRRWEAAARANLRREIGAL